jgi:hypothetical protein
MRNLGCKKSQKAQTSGERQLEYLNGTGMNFCPAFLLARIGQAWHFCDFLRPDIGFHRFRFPWPDWKNWNLKFESWQCPEVCP